MVLRPTTLLSISDALTRFRAKIALLLGSDNLLCKCGTAAACSRPTYTPLERDWFTDSRQDGASLLQFVDLCIDLGKDACHFQVNSPERWM